MKNKYSILKPIKKSERNLAVLIDPDKTQAGAIASLCEKINASIATHVFVGGSEVEDNKTEDVVIELKNHTNLPVILFPGDVTQITEYADGLLFLSLISGRNPDYLIGKHVEAVSKLKDTNLEVIPTGYILVENGKQTAVERVSDTKPIKRNSTKLIIDTAKAGELLGMKLIYLEAGSGATHPIEAEIILEVKRQLHIPLIVGGGIRSKQHIEKAYNSGANMVVIGTAFEQDEDFFEALKN